MRGRTVWVVFAHPAFSCMSGRRAAQSAGDLSCDGSVLDKGILWFPGVQGDRYSAFTSPLTGARTGKHRTSYGKLGQVPARVVAQPGPALAAER